MAGVALAVEGYTDVLRALKTVDKKMRAGVRKEIRQAAEPVRATAEVLAVARIRGIDAGDPWSAMRVGITQTSVYVAPVKRGLKAGSRKRPNLALLMQARVMEPALYQHQEEVFAHIDSLIGRECDRFNAGGLMLADRITLEGVAPWDGDYTLDIDEQPLTTSEWGWIKRRAGYLPLTLDAQSFADPELIAVLAAIAVRRTGAVEARDMDGLLDRLFDAPFGTTITLQPGDTAGDADPPPASSGSRQSFNGDSSPTDMETSDGTPPATGPPPSATSVSAPATSAT